MLVLSRKTNQEILINGDIKVSVLKIKGNVVRIGIEAPAEVSIKRSELVTQAIELPLAETTGDSEESASFVLSIDSQSSTVSEEAAGFQLLPMPTDDSQAGCDSANLEYDLQTQFPETMQRGLCCDPIVLSQETA